jgi:hypothetical protein
MESARSQAWSGDQREELAEAGGSVPSQEPCGNKPMFVRTRLQQVRLLPRGLADRSGG